MTEYIYRVALVIPSPQLAAARRVSAASGWGEGAYTVPLSSDGSLPATHWGMSTVATQSFLDALDAAGDGFAPDSTDAADVDAVMAELKMVVGPATSTNAKQQFAALCATLGLTRIMSGEV